MTSEPNTTNQDQASSEAGKKIERCVTRLMNDPNFKPEPGKDKKASAIAVCKNSVTRAEEVNKQLQK